MQCGFLAAATDSTVEVDLIEYIEIEDTERKGVGTVILQDQDDLYILTKDKEMFDAHLETYSNAAPGMLFFFYVEDGVVRLIVEKPFA